MPIALTGEKTDAMLTSRTPGAVAVAVAFECAHATVAVTCLATESTPPAVPIVTTLPTDSWPAGGGDEH